MTGNIVFDETGGQFIGKGLVDTERGGLYGISLVCSVGYQCNWQAGWILATEQNGSTPRPLYLDSAAGTTLRVWDAAEDEGLEVAHDGITFSDDTTQTTAWTGDQAVGTTDSVTFAGVTITGTFPGFQIAQVVGLYYDSDAGYWLLDCGDEEHQGVISRFSLMSCEEIEFLDDTVQTTAWTGTVDAANVTGLATVATSGSYDDLDDKPTIPTEYTLPTATNSVLGGVKIGTGVTITDGVISVSTAYAAASHTHDASDINSGTIATARLGSGSATSTTFLAGDQTWKTVTSGSTNASDLTSGTLSNARLSSRARAAINTYLWSSFR
jgi:hypothetical protein